jgi:hypothetical protein
MRAVLVAFAALTARAAAVGHHAHARAAVAAMREAAAPMTASQDQTNHSESDCEMHHALENERGMLQSCVRLHEEVLRRGRARS